MMKKLMTLLALILLLSGCETAGTKPCTTNEDCKDPLLGVTTAFCTYPDCESTQKYCVIPCANDQTCLTLTSVTVSDLFSCKGGSCFTGKCEKSQTVVCENGRISLEGLGASYLGICGTE